MSTQVIHPEKVADVEIIIRKSWVSLRNGPQYPVFIVIGAGTFDSYYGDHQHDRELHKLISFCDFKGIPRKNIITVDDSDSICWSWKKQGVSAMCMDWTNIGKMKAINDYAYTLGYKSYSDPIKIVYANTYGNRKDVSLYPGWLEVFKPRVFLGLYAARSAYNLTDVWRLSRKYKGYSPIDLGMLGNTDKIGITYYSGLFMVALEKYKRVNLLKGGESNGKRNKIVP